MDIIAVKIESAYISLAQINENNGLLRVSGVRRAALPEDMWGAAALAERKALIEFLLSVLKYSGMEIKNLAVYFGAGLEHVIEYRFNEPNNDAARVRLLQQEKKALLAKAGPSDNWRMAEYRYNGMDDGIAASAVLAADAEFCDELVTALAKEGYTVSVISSSLIAFAEVAKTVSDIEIRVLVLCVEKQELQAALFAYGRLIHLARFPQGTETPDSAEQLLPFISDKIKVVLCGFESQNTKLREALKKAGVVTIDAVYQKIKGEQTSIVLSEEFANQEALYPGVFSAAAFPCATDVPLYRKGSPVYWKGSPAEKTHDPSIYAICIATIIIAFFICAIAPLTLIFADREYAENKARLAEPDYIDIKEKIKLYRALYSELRELQILEYTVPWRDLSYANTVEELKSGLLLNTRIEKMSYEKDIGILAVFTTEDTEIFDILKNIMNESGRLYVTEPHEREEIGENEWRIQINVVQVPPQEASL